MTTMAAFVLLLCSSAAGLTVLHQEGPLTVATTAPVEQGVCVIGLADTLTLTLTVTGPVGTEFKLPEPATRAPGWRLLKASPLITTPGKQDLVRLERTLVFEPLAPGASVLQMEPVWLRLPSEQGKSLTLPPVVVQVHTRVTEADLAKLREAVAVEKPPASPPPADWWWLALMAAGLALAGLGLLGWRRWRAPRAARPPEEVALSQLERLGRLGLHERGLSERFHTLLANIVRSYLERKYGLPARRRTTPEFLQEVQSDAPLDPQVRAFLADFLRRCDLIKFAGVEADAQQSAALLEDVRRFVRGGGVP